MNSSPVTKKALIKFGFLSLLTIFFLYLLQTFNNQTKIIFCDVGQGDAAYIRIKNKVDVLIDAGPDKKVLHCLGKYMPFWDRKIELAIISHHDKDHYGGFLYIIDRYQIDKLLTANYRFDSKTYKKFTNKIKNKKISYKFINKENKIMVLNDVFSIYWPPDDLKLYDSNDYSLVFLFKENNFKVLFTGDASPKVLNEIASSLSTTEVWTPPRNDMNVNILKIPHHGSKNGLTKKFLDLANPKIAVISVGKNNPYGHPSREVLDMLKAKNINIRRTDKEGDIVFKIQNYKYQETNELQ